MVLVLTRRLQEPAALLEGQAVVAGKGSQDEGHEWQGYEGVASCHVVCFWEGADDDDAWDGGLAMKACDGGALGQDDEREVEVEVAALPVLW